MTRPTWLNELEENGFAVVKGVVPPKDCADFREAALDWLEVCLFGDQVHRMY